jgi:hypothetical protein
MDDDDNNKGEKGLLKWRGTVFNADDSDDEGEDADDGLHMPTQFKSNEV